MSQQVNCESLKSFKECSQHSDQCTVIEGELCAAPGTTDKETLFGYCVSNVVATTYASTSSSSSSFFISIIVSLHRIASSSCSPTCSC